MRWTMSDPKSQKALTNSLKWCIVLMDALTEVAVLTGTTPPLLPLWSLETETTV